MYDGLFTCISLFSYFIVHKLLSTFTIVHGSLACERSRCNCLKRLSRDELYVQRLLKSSTTHSFNTDHDHTETSQHDSETMPLLQNVIFIFIKETNIVKS